jgi:hypothetical protein
MLLPLLTFPLLILIETMHKLSFIKTRKKKSGVVDSKAPPSKPQGSRTASRTHSRVDSSRTTVSSNAVVLAAKDKEAKENDESGLPNDGDNSCEFLKGPEDETGERDAALSSPIKGNQRPTNAVSHVPYCHTILTA